MQRNFKTEYFDCICTSIEHTIRFVLSFYEDDPEIHLEVYLNQYRNVFKRMWTAIKYIFGYKCKYGHWDCWELSSIEDAERLKDILEKYIKLKNACNK